VGEVRRMEKVKTTLVQTNKQSGDYGGVAVVCLSDR
jgi:hypothetical protein